MRELRCTEDGRLRQDGDPPPWMDNRRVPLRYTFEEQESGDCPSRMPIRPVLTEWGEIREPFLVVKRRPKRRAPASYDVPFPPYLPMTGPPQPKPTAPPPQPPAVLRPGLMLCCFEHGLIVHRDCEVASLAEALVHFPEAWCPECGFEDQPANMDE